MSLDAYFIEEELFVIYSRELKLEDFLIVLARTSHFLPLNFLCKSVELVSLSLNVSLFYRNHFLPSYSRENLNINYFVR